jgi:hypothetical protein
MAHQREINIARFGKIGRTEKIDFIEGLQRQARAIVRSLQGATIGAQLAGEATLTGIARQLEAAGGAISEAGSNVGAIGYNIQQGAAATAKATEAINKYGKYVPLAALGLGAVILLK